MKKIVLLSLLIFGIGYKALAQTDLLPPISKWQVTRKDSLPIDTMFKTDRYNMLTQKSSYQLILKHKQEGKIWLLSFWVQETVQYNAVNKTKSVTRELEGRKPGNGAPAKDIILTLIEDDTIVLISDSPQLLIQHPSVTHKNGVAGADLLAKIIQEYLDGNETYKKASVSRRSNRIRLENWKLNKKGNLSFFTGVNYMPGTSFRSYKYISPSDYAYAEYQNRNREERNIFGYKVDVNVGVTHRSKHHYYVSLHQQQSGFQTDSTQKINWETGLKDGGAYENNVIYRFQQLGFGLGYKFVGYSHSLISPVFDVSLFYSGITSFSIKVDGKEPTIKSKQLKQEEIRPAQFGIQLGIGLAARFNYRVDAHVVPAIAYNVTSVNYGKYMKAYLFNTGIQIGINYRIGVKG